MPLPIFKIAIPRRLWPAVAIAAGAASVSAAAYGGAIGFIILAAVIIGIGGVVIASSRWGLRCHWTASRSALAVAGAGGVIAALAGSIAVVVAQRLNCAAPSFAGRRRVGIFFTVAVFAIASITAASLTTIILAQLRAGDAAAAEYYNSHHYITQAPTSGGGMNVNYGNLAFLILPVIGLGAVLFFAMCGGAITSGILSGTFAIRRNIPGYRLDPTDRIVFLVEVAIFLAAVPAAIILWYGGANGPYPYFGEPPTARAVATWWAAIAAILLSIAVAPVLLAAAIVKLAAKTIAPEAGAPPASR